MSSDSAPPAAATVDEAYPPPISISKWIEENSKFFLPPVCNKMMYNAGLIKVMYVGGPNSRKDYHMELGEEIFYQVKGDMCLPIIEKGVPKLVTIKEGEIFVLPARIPHSPQRFENTIGLVVERERLEDEIDGMRWYCDTKPDFQTNPIPLYQEVFHCYDLGVQLKPVLQRFLASKQHATGEPQPKETDDPNEPGHQPLPWSIDVETEVKPPILFSKWLEEHDAELQRGETVRMYGGNSRKDGRDEFEIDVCGGKGEEVRHENKDLEVMFWQLKGDISLKIDDGQQYQVKEGDIYLLKKGLGYTETRPKGSIGFVIVMNPYYYNKEVLAKKQ